jgi:hypothetical protein
MPLLSKKLKEERKIEQKARIKEQEKQVKKIRKI